MTVKAILSHKGRDVVTLEPTATLDRAVRVLAEHRIGAVVVIGADHRVIGILSERDIVRAISIRGTAALDEPLTQSMTRGVTTCSESDTVAALMEHMTRGRFRHVPVVENGRLAGIVSIGDVVNHRLHEIEAEQSAIVDYIRTA